MMNFESYSSVDSLMRDLTAETLTMLQLLTKLGDLLAASNQTSIDLTSISSMNSATYCHDCLD